MDIKSQQQFKDSSTIPKTKRYFSKRGLYFVYVYIVFIAIAIINANLCKGYFCGQTGLYYLDYPWPVIFSQHYFDHGYYVSYVFNIVILYLISFLIQNFNAKNFFITFGIILLEVSIFYFLLFSSFSPASQEADIQRSLDKIIKVIPTLPFTVFKSEYVPNGVKNDDNYIINWYDDMDVDEVYVSKTLHFINPEAWEPDPYDADNLANLGWGTIFFAQNKEKLKFPNSCPGLYWTVYLENRKNEPLNGKCAFAATIEKGFKLYISTNYYPYRKIISADINGTLVVLEFYRGFRPEDITEIVKVFDSLIPMTDEELINDQKDRGVQKGRGIQQPSK